MGLQIANETAGNNDSTLSNTMPLTNTTERSLGGPYLHRPDDDTPRASDHLDDLPTPKAAKVIVRRKLVMRSSCFWVFGCDNYRGP